MPPILLMDEQVASVLTFVRNTWGNISEPIMACADSRSASRPDTTVISTFDPHSLPAGVMFAGDEFPESVRGTLLFTRFGNLLNCDPDVGFDVLQMRVTKGANGLEATTTSWFSPLARPIDIIALGGAIYVLEYSRALDQKGGCPDVAGPFAGAETELTEAQSKSRGSEFPVRSGEGRWRGLAMCIGRSLPAKSVDDRGETSRLRGFWIPE